MLRSITHQSSPALSQLMLGWQKSSVEQLQKLNAHPVPIEHTHADIHLQSLQSKPGINMARPELGFINPPLIGPDDKVLHIGDSHTVGIYGKEMDQLLRSTGAQVASYGSAGSSPSWWLSGQSTHSGFFSRDTDGKTVQPRNWREAHPTPKFSDLIQRTKPNVIIISLGANLINASGNTIETQVHKLAKIAKESGAKIIWIGPPDGRESKKPNSKQNALYEHLQNAARQYGSFIDSRPLTEYPKTGGDGLHYWGQEGSKIARSWAHEVFEQIQKTE